MIIFFPKYTHSSNVIPIKIPVRLFVDTGKITLKCIWKGSEIKIVELCIKCRNEPTLYIIYL